MKVRVLKQCDGTINGVITAMFLGQSYEIPDDEAKKLIAGGFVVSLVEDTKEVTAPKAASRPRAKRRS